jgi:hypothetical protein
MESAKTVRRRVFIEAQGTFAWGTRFSHRRVTQREAAV